PDLLDTLAQLALGCRVDSSQPLDDNAVHRYFFEPYFMFTRFLHHQSSVLEAAVFDEVRREFLAVEHAVPRVVVKPGLSAVRHDGTSGAEPDHRANLPNLRVDNDGIPVAIPRN